ncbi:CYBR1 reductase, partial [Atractosteus spatula]|nr:CYBR1 reductase [Atractosteus spatula]
AAEMAMENYKQFLFFLATSLSVGFVAVVFVLRWVLYFRGGLAWDGDLAEFNWHPVLTVTGFIFIQGIAIVVYRLPWTWKCSKLMMKFIHAGLNTLAFIIAIISLVAVFDFHNTKNIPNMYSLHSWVGLAAVILYALQLLLGLCIYLVPITPVSIRAALMPIHVFSGLFIFASVIAAALMGITEKLIFSLNNPKYSSSPPEAIFVNVLGLLLLLYGALILWIATRSPWKRPSEQPAPARLSNGGGCKSDREGLTMSDSVAEVRNEPDPSSEARRRNPNQDEAGQRSTM